MKLKLQNGKYILSLSKADWVKIGSQNAWTGDPIRSMHSWCLANGFQGICDACLEKALKSDSVGIRSRAQQYIGGREQTDDFGDLKVYQDNYEGNNLDQDNTSK